MRILSISSQVAYGPVGNSAAVPALQARGHEVLAVPTVTLSHHPGHGTPAGFRTGPQDLALILQALDERGILEGVGAVLTGYFAASSQIEAVAPVLARLKAARPGLHVLVDPVIGDEGGLYVAADVATAMRETLLPLATMTTPNRFELSWLADRAVGDQAGAVAAAHRLGVAEVLATSVPAGPGRLATLLVCGADVEAVLTPRLDGVPHGTGDFLSGLYLAARVDTSPAPAFAAAMKTLARAIAISAGTPVLNVAEALHPR